MSWFNLVVSLLASVATAQQQQSITYLDIGGVFPLLTTAGAVDPVGVMRQAGKIKNCFSLTVDH